MWAACLARRSNTHFLFFYHYYNIIRNIFDFNTKRFEVIRKNFEKSFARENINFTIIGGKKIFAYFENEKDLSASQDR